MAAKKNNNQALLIALAVAAAGGLIYFVTKKKKTEVVNQEPEAEQPAAATNTGTTTSVKPATTTATTTTTTLNKGLVLKKGSTGKEVKELQKLLGITADGIFGAQTETALYNKKKVKQITLGQYTALPKGTQVWANAYPKTTFYKVNENADGSFKLLSEKKGTVEGGDVLGKIISVTADGTRYVLEDYKWYTLPEKGWVYASQVKKV
jgi:hypothetical protein